MDQIPEAGYEMVDHPADLRFRIWGPQREALFRQAARCLLETLFSNTGTSESLEGIPPQQVEIRLEGIDLDDLLVRWLGELHFQAETRHLIPASIHFHRLDRELLHADCSMRPAGNPDREIKAVTYHQSGIEECDDRLEATLLFDV